MRATLLALLLLVIPAGADEPPALTPRRRQQLEERGKQLYAGGEKLYQAGKPAEALPVFLELLKVLQEYHGDEPHEAMAYGLRLVGVTLNAAGQPARAVPYLEQALAMYHKLYPEAKYPDGHPDLASSLHNLGTLLQDLGQSERALQHFQQALPMFRKLYPASKSPNGHPDFAKCLHNLGTVLSALGRPEEALPHRRDALAMLQKLHPPSKYPDGHPDVANGFQSLGDTLQTMGRADQALSHYRDALTMYRKLFPASKFPDGHPKLAVCLNDLGVRLQEMGQADQALPHLREALAIVQKLYPESTHPDGHPDLARAFNNLGGVLHMAGRVEQAVPYYRDCLALRRKLYPASQYPDGHPELANSLINLGGAMQTLGRLEQALSYYRAALTMSRALYPESKHPNGHPDLAWAMSNLGTVLLLLGRGEEALSLLQSAVAMRRLHAAAHYPDGHPDLATSLSNLGAALEALGRSEQALPHVRDALAMQQRLLRRELASASEEAAFDKVRAEPRTYDGYLSVSLSTKAPPAEVAAQLWPSRALVTRLLEQRQAAARATGTEAGGRLNELRQLRRHLDQLLQDTRRPTDERDRLIAQTMERRDRLEREVVAAIPALQHWQELDRLGPADLARALPPGAAFIDLIRYEQFEFADGKPQRTPRYVAFVLGKDRPIRRVEFGAAKPIDDAVTAWRASIEKRRDEAPAAAELRRLVWANLATALPADAATIYLAADGDLARLPWAALPIGDDKALLEKYAIAQVPHGTFLLDRLKFGKPLEGPAALLTLGGVDFGPGPWPPLPGSSAEVRAIAAVAPGRITSLAGQDATTERLNALLPQARYVHLATHGEFKAREFAHERQRADDVLAPSPSAGAARKTAAKNPLGYVGLVLARGEVMSGLTIQDLPLKQTHLVTLSACETGLGEWTGGEGVQGLQRAFHLAGCPNVVASLWKVNDAATAALMAKFYHELWVNKQPPLAALRTAQLTIYRHPELIPDLAGERGAPKLKEAVAVKPGEPSRVSGRILTPTKLWAAFVLSGAGQ